MSELLRSLENSPERSEVDWLIFRTSNGQCGFVGRTVLYREGVAGRPFSEPGSPRPRKRIWDRRFRM